MFSISILGVLVAAVVCFVIGFLFHGPLFGKLWMRLANIHPTGNEKFSDMYGKMFWNFISNIIAAYVLGVLINAISHSTLSALTGYAAGLVASLLLWLVIAAGSSMEVIWMGRKKSLWMFELVASLVCYVAMGVVLVMI